MLLKRTKEGQSVFTPPARRKGCFILKGMQGVRNHLLFTTAVAIKYHAMSKAEFLNNFSGKL